MILSQCFSVTRCDLEFLKDSKVAHNDIDAFARIGESEQIIEDKIADNGARDLQLALRCLVQVGHKVTHDKLEKCFGLHREDLLLLCCIV